jgi:hypothetical protein
LNRPGRTDSKGEMDLAEDDDEEIETHHLRVFLELEDLQGKENLFSRCVLIELISILSVFQDWKQERKCMMQQREKGNKRTRTFDRGFDFDPSEIIGRSNSWSKQIDCKSRYLLSLLFLFFFYRFFAAISGFLFQIC